MDYGGLLCLLVLKVGTLCRRGLLVPCSTVFLVPRIRCSRDVSYVGCMCLIVVVELCLPLAHLTIMTHVIIVCSEYSTQALVPSLLKGLSPVRAQRGGDGEGRWAASRQSSCLELASLLQLWERLPAGLSLEKPAKRLSAGTAGM